MTPSANADLDTTSDSARGAWFALALAAAWTVLIRLPLILNAPTHLDSDLAVDGLTLGEAVSGHLRWHYPGTPYMGILPVLLSLPQAMAWGATPATLVSGGAVAAVALLAACFWLARESFGGRVAAWSLLPLMFASTGAVWLSGRITGGHLLTAAWHAATFACLARLLRRPNGRTYPFLFGLWCGLGLYLDSMFLITTVGLVAAIVVARTQGPIGLDAWGVGLIILGLLAGVSPRPLGAWLDPYDSYPQQFTLTLQPEHLANHTRLLLLECLPRLIVGHRLPDLATDPDPGALYNRAEVGGSLGLVALVATTLGLLLVVGAAWHLSREAFARRITPPRAILIGLILTALATFAGFILNLNIYNSDNYRYLVTCLVPWSLGFGLLMSRLGASGRTGWTWGVAIAAGFAVVMTADLGQWYARFGWVDARGFPVVRGQDDPVLEWLEAHPEVHWIEAGYWDVYRIAFLTRERVRGVPFPVYPNRFPEWMPTADAASVVVVRATREGAYFRAEALRSGRKIVFRSRGVTLLR